MDDPIVEGGLNGDATNLVIAPTGTVAVKLTLGACLFLAAYLLWMRYALVVHGGVQKGCCAAVLGRVCGSWLHPVSLLDEMALREAEMTELHSGSDASAAESGEVGAPPVAKMHRTVIEAMIVQELATSLTLSSKNEALTSSHL